MNPLTIALPSIPNPDRGSRTLTIPLRIDPIRHALWFPVRRVPSPSREERGGVFVAASFIAICEATEIQKIGDLRSFYVSSHLRLRLRLQDLPHGTRRRFRRRAPVLFAHAPNALVDTFGNKRLETVCLLRTSVSSPASRTRTCVLRRFKLARLNRPVLPIGLSRYKARRPFGRRVFNTSFVCGSYRPFFAKAKTC